jgi:hypothetical protein
LAHALHDLDFMSVHKTIFVRSDSGQSLVETVLMMPLLLLLLLNAMNFGYFFLVTVNLTAAPRSGVEYAIQGSATPAAISLPNSGAPTALTSVSYLTYQDMTGALNNPTDASVQVCSQTNIDTFTNSGFNGTGASKKANCVTCSGSTCGSPGTGNPVPNSDPELNSASTAPAFVLHRVDVTYQFSPLIPGTPFNIFLLATPICNAGGTSCTFTRHAEMRAMN